MKKNEKRLKKQRGLGEFVLSCLASLANQAASKLVSNQQKKQNFSFKDELDEASCHSIVWLRFVV